LRYALRCYPRALNGRNRKRQRKKRRCKPFFLLLPTYVTLREWFRQEIAQLRPDVQPFFIVPDEPYHFDHPTGKGHDSPPFESLWIVGAGTQTEEVFAEVVEHLRSSSQDAERSGEALNGGQSDQSDHPPPRAGKQKQNAARPRTRGVRILRSTAELHQHGVVNLNRKRPNPRQRKRMRRKRQAMEASTSDAKGSA